MTQEPSDTGVALAHALGHFPSVTEILRAAGLGPNYNGVPAAFLERKALLGTALHRAIQYDVEGVLDNASLHPDLAGRFSAYRQLVGAGWRIELAEVELIEPRWRVVGHVDALGRTPRGARCLIDWKGVESLDLDAVAFQLGAYDWLNRQIGDGARTPYAIELHADGSFRVHNLAQRIAELTAEQVFLAAVLVHHARARRAR